MLVGRLADAVVEAGKRHPAVRVVQSGDDGGDDMVGIARGAAEEPGMQVAVGGDDGELLADQAAEHDGDRRARRGSTSPCRRPAPRRRGAPPRCPRGSGGRLALPDSSSPSRIIETLTGSLPATLIQARQASTKVMSWPLSSDAPRRDDPLPAVDGDEARLEGRRGPLGERVDRLDVVVSVEQDVRVARATPVMGDDHRMTGAWPGPRHRSRGRSARRPANRPRRDTRGA